jgi:hypothetical protein
MDTIVVFVHGWSVSHTDTYGQLPARLAKDAAGQGLSIKVKEIHLGRYISFHDEVRVKDIARAFETAVADQLGTLMTTGRRFVCITHSTGGPVIREWWHRYYQEVGTPTCPMSHLVMLAPANYGSALALLGKGKLSRLSSWFNGVEPGQGVLDWLALGSIPAWELNQAWITSKAKHIGPKGVYPFVITGQSIDRKLYDNLNTYTGELGSDGVVRAAAANLQGRYLRLVQQAPVEKLHPKTKKKTGKYHAPALVLDAEHVATDTPFRIVPKRSHSGKAMGIMRSVRSNPGASQKNQPTVDAILSCIKVQSKDDYKALVKVFKQATEEVQADEQLEVVKGMLWGSTDFIHDRYAMVAFRVTDHEGYPVTDFDLTITAGPNDDPNHLPKGFFADRQLNPKNRNTVTYYFNHSTMTGCKAVIDVNDGNREARPALTGTQALGFKIVARPDEGFAHYMECSIAASAEVMKGVLEANQTTMVDIVLRRVVGEETFRLDKGIRPSSFKNTKPGKPLAD